MITSGLDFGFAKEGLLGHPTEENVEKPKTSQAILNTALRLARGETALELAFMPVKENDD